MSDIQRLSHFQYDIYYGCIEYKFIYTRRIRKCRIRQTYIILVYYGRNIVQYSSFQGRIFLILVNSDELEHFESDPNFE